MCTSLGVFIPGCGCPQVHYYLCAFVPGNMFFLVVCRSVYCFINFPSFDSTMKTTQLKTGSESASKTPPT